MPWVRTFFTNVEVLPPDGHVVSEGNLRRIFALHDLYEFIFHITIVNENYLFWIVFHMGYKDTEQGAREWRFCNSRWRNTHWIRSSPNEWPSVSREIPVSLNKTFSEASCTSNQPALWTHSIIVQYEIWKVKWISWILVFLGNLPMVRRTLFCRCWSFIRWSSSANFQAGQP
jgi:hypothetical protein